MISKIYSLVKLATPSEYISEVIVKGHAMGQGCIIRLDKVTFFTSETFVHLW